MAGLDVVGKLDVLNELDEELLDGLEELNELEGLNEWKELEELDEELLDELRENELGGCDLDDDAGANSSGVFFSGCISIVYSLHLT
jgi:hypothetical protein